MREGFGVVVADLTQLGWLRAGRRLVRLVRYRAVLLDRERIANRWAEGLATLHEAHLPDWERDG